MAINSSIYLATQDIAERTGAIVSSYRTKDGRFIINHSDLMRVQFSTEELLNGISDKVEQIDEETATTLIRENGYKLGRGNENLNDNDNDEPNEANEPNGEDGMTESREDGITESREEGETEPRDDGETESRNDGEENDGETESRDDNDDDEPHGANGANGQS